MNLAGLLLATWPPARSFSLGPFTLNDGAGGGKRVCAASVNTPFSAAELAAAEAGMRNLGQQPLFVIWQQDDDFGLDKILAQRGYTMIDPVIGYGAKISEIVNHGIDISDTYTHWPPLAITREIWAQAGTAAARLDVMARASGPKTAILARSGDHPAAVCFVGMSGDAAMIHALEVLPAYRRNGRAQRLIARAAHWAGENGAVQLSLVVTRANAPARALYAQMGMAEGKQYHYRQMA